MDRIRELNRLADGIRSCRRCGLHCGRTHAVPGEGSVSARFVLVGEAPGRREDETGRPFIGAAGRYLDELMTRVGLERKACFITSCVKCRPTKNRTPRMDEVSICCDTWLERQLELVSPDLIVLFGTVAAKRFIAAKPVIRDLRGRVHAVGNRRFVVTYHPASAMRFPTADHRIREDFHWLSDMETSS